MWFLETPSQIWTCSRPDLAGPNQSLSNLLRRLQKLMRFLKTQDVSRAGNPFSPWAQRVWGWWVRSKPIELWLGLGFWKPNRDPGAQQRGRSVIDCCVVIWGVLYRGCAFGARCGGCALGVRFSFDTPPCILDAGFIGLGRTLPPVIP